MEGIVRLRVHVRADGTVQRADVVEDPGWGLGAAAREATSRFRFAPARNAEGRAVASVIRSYVFRFELR